MVLINFLEHCPDGSAAANQITHFLILFMQSKSFRYSGENHNLLLNITFRTDHVELLDLQPVRLAI